MRFGLRTNLKNRWTPKGIRPKGNIKIGYQWGYLYAAVNPKEGLLQAWLMPDMQQNTSKTKAACSSLARNFIRRDQPAGQPHHALRTLSCKRASQPRMLVSRLTVRSSRTCFVTPNPWQKKLAMALAPLRKSA